MAWALTVAALLVSVVSTPEPEALAKAAALGLGDTAGRLAVHLAPVLVCIVMLSLVQWVRVGGPLFRAALLGLAGGACGFFFGLCLTAFGGLMPTIEAWLGEVRDLTPVEMIGVIVGSMLIILGMVFGALPVVRGMFTRRGKTNGPASGEGGGDGLDQRDLDMVGMAAPAWFAQGSILVLLGFLNAATLTPQSPATPSVISVIVLLTLVLLWSLARIMRGFDEFERRQQMTVYSLAIVAGFAISGLYLGLGGTGLLPPPDGYALLTVWNTVYLMVALPYSMHQAVLLARASRSDDVDVA